MDPLGIGDVPAGEAGAAGAALDPLTHAGPAARLGPLRTPRAGPSTTDPVSTIT